MSLGVAIVLVATLIGCAIGVRWLLSASLPLWCCPECGSYNVAEGNEEADEALTCEECGHTWLSV